MKQLNAKQFGIASGLTSVVIYLGCFLIMTILGKGSLIKLSNMLFHGMDFTNIIRMDVPFIETLLGAILSFLFWGLSGFFLAFTYNRIRK